MRETIGNLFNHLFSLRQSLFFPVVLGRILLTTLVHSGTWKDTDGALRESFIFTYLMNNNVIFSIFIRYWISNFWIGSPRLSHSSWLFSLLINLYVLYIFFSFESFFRNTHCKYSLKVCTLTFHPLSIDIQHRHFNIYLHFHKKLAWKFYLFIFLNTLKILFLCNFYWSGWEVRYHCFLKVLKTLIFSSRFIISIFKINFYWSIVGLQC